MAVRAIRDAVRLDVDDADRARTRTGRLLAELSRPEPVHVPAGPAVAHAGGAR